MTIENKGTNESQVVIKDDSAVEISGENNDNFMTEEEIAKMEDEEKKPEVPEPPVEPEPKDDEAKIVSIDDTEYVLDEEGNALNEDGTTFKSKEELTELTNKPDPKEDKELISIDNKDYTLDDKGNAVDAKGEVAFTKEDIDAMGGETPTFDIAEIGKTTAIEMYDEEGKVVEYENTTEGLASHTTDVYNKGGSDKINELYQAYPEVESLVRHIQLGGDSTNFNTRVDYNKVKLNKENEQQLKDIIYKAQTARGNRTDAIERYYKALSAGDTDNDNIYDEAEAELKYLQDSDKEANAEQDRLLQQQQHDNAIQTNDYWGVAVDNGQLKDLNKDGSVYSIIKSGKLKLKDKTYTIPEKTKVIVDGKPVIYTRDQVFSYLYSPVTTVINGERITATQEQIDTHYEQQNRTTSNDIFDAYRRLVKYDDSQFITEQVNSNKVKYIKKLTSKKNIKSGGTTSRKTINKADSQIVIK
jgi:hypothetical protein